MHSISISFGKIAHFAILMMLTFCGIKWIPLLPVGGGAIELHNAATLLAILVLMTSLVVKRTFWFPVEYLLCFTLLFFLVFFNVVRGGGGVPTNISVSLPALLASVLLVQYPSINIIQEAIGRCFIVSILTLAFSAYISGENFLLGLIRYLTSFDRNEFLYGILRPMFNAFGASDDEVIYGGSYVNHLASSFFLFFALGTAMLVGGKNKLVFRLVAVVSFVMIFILLSSTVMAAAIITLFLVIFLAALEKKNTTKVVFFVLILFFFSPFYAPYLLGYISAGVIGDESSVTTRASQNIAAIESIENSLVLGGGTVSHDGHGLHNLPLYAWTEGGLICFCIVLLLYVVCVRSMIVGIVCLMVTKDLVCRRNAFLMVSMSAFFLIRTMFGGGGGLPSTTEAFALGVLVCSRHGIAINKKSLRGKSGLINPYGKRFLND